MIDTGMGREGILWKTLKDKDLQEIKDYKNIDLIGVCTHFAVSDENNKKGIDYTNYQIENFLKVKKQVEKIFGQKKIIFHSANSGAILLNKKVNFNMVRSGILTYGYEKNLSKEIKPFLEIKSKIILIKKISKGAFIGYGKTYQSEKEEFVGIVPIGYGDGLLRSGSNKIKFIVNNKYAEILGRISMDQVSIRVDEKTKIGDEVIILCKQKNKQASTENLAKLTGTIPYEILTNFSDKKRIVSVYKYN